MSKEIKKININLETIELNEAELDLVAGGSHEHTDSEEYHTETYHKTSKTNKEEEDWFKQGWHNKGWKSWDDSHFPTDTY
jgi:hypothetical protein